MPRQPSGTARRQIKVMLWRNAASGICTTRARVLRRITPRQPIGIKWLMPKSRELGRVSCKAGVSFQTADGRRPVRAICGLMGQTQLHSTLELLLAHPVGVNHLTD